MMSPPGRDPDPPGIMIVPEGTPGVNAPRRAKPPSPTVNATPVRLETADPSRGDGKDPEQVADCIHRRNKSNDHADEGGTKGPWNQAASSLCALRPRCAPQV